MQPEADLYSISYRSRAVRPMTASEWHQLEATSHVRNAGLGVTGALLFDGEFFMQTIEGPRPSLVDLMARIQRDPRHVEIIPFGVRAITTRIFAGSAMKLVGPDRVPRAVLSQFGYLNLRDETTLEELKGLMTAA